MPHRRPTSARGREWQPGARARQAEHAPSPPTINDIARLARVSKKTVSRVINDSPLVRSETRARVNEAIAESGYVPDPQARGLAFRRAFLIGMIYDDQDCEPATAVQRGILAALKGSGYELVVRTCDRKSASAIEEVRSFVARQKLAGIVVPPPLSYDERLSRQLDQLGCRHIRIVPAAQGPTTVLASHDYAGAREAVRYLANLGHVLIGHIAGPAQFGWARERHRGYVDGLAEAGLKPTRRYERDMAGTPESGLAAAHVLLQLDPRPTAIFAASDDIAVAVLKAAEIAGIAVPDALSVVGFGDSSFAARLPLPLSTVRPAYEDLGRMAARILMEPDRVWPAAENGPRPELVIRRTSAPPLSPRS